MRKVHRFAENAPFIQREKKINIGPIKLGAYLPFL
jgi:hypothetical protein